MRLLILIFAFVGAGSTSDCTEHLGKFQSPINIDTNQLVVRNIGQIQFSQGYNKLPDKMTLTNNGHSFNVEAKLQSPLHITFPMYPVKYEFLQLHFHWGNVDSMGSEHTVNNKSYPLEMHVVHTQTENSNYPRYLVIGHFFTLALRTNGGIQSMLGSMLYSAARPNVAVPIKPVKLSQFFPVEPFSYYTYEGSLTTPPFLESVRWIVASKPIVFTRLQLAVFRRSAQIDLGLFNNYRCVQDLEGRDVIYNH